MNGNLSDGWGPVGMSALGGRNFRIFFPGGPKSPTRIARPIERSRAYRA